MTTASLRDRRQKVFSCLGGVGFRPLTLFRRNDRTMEAAHPEIVRFSRAADARRRGALRSGETGRRP